MSQKHIRWLLGELDSLVSGGVLEASSAGRLREHYEALKEPPKRLRELFFVVLGAVLIGGGVILLLAHNWSDLSRPVRTIIAFLPLVLMQGLTIFGLRTGRNSLAGREGVGIGLMLAVAVALALVGQTYHVPYDLGPFLLRWMILTLPILYVLRATLPAMVYLVGVTSWAFSDLVGQPQGWVVWVLLLLAAPFVVAQLRHAGRARAQLLGWTTALTLPCVVGVTFLPRAEPLWAPLLALVFGWMWFEGEESRKGRSWLTSPFSIVGALGVLGMALVLSFGEGVASYLVVLANLWDMLPDQWLLLLVAAVAVARWGWLALAARRRANLAGLALGTFLILILVLMTGVAFDDWLLKLVANGYLVAVGLLAMREGFVRESAGWANAGLGVLSLLILVRFFDSDLPLVARGLAFVAVGIGFLVANRTLNRRMQGNLGGAA